MSTMVQPYRSSQIEVYGEDAHIAALVKRMRYMIPGADEAPDMTIWKAAQIASMHRLDPFGGDVQVYKIGNSWLVNVGISAWRREAQRQAKYQPVMEQMTDAEVQRWLGDKYTSGDVGYRCKIYRLDVAREAKELGIPYEPSIAHGFWMQKARYDKYKKQWMPDQIPNTETPDSVARRRAEKKALKIAFSLGYPDIEMQNDAHGQLTVVEDIERQVVSEERNRAPVMHLSAVDDDGLFAVDSTPSRVNDAPPSSLDEVEHIDQNGGIHHGVETDGYDTGAEWNAMPGAAETDASRPSVADTVRAALTEKAKQFVEWATQLDADPKDGACTYAQYRFLFSLFRNLTGRGNESTAMEVVFGREVDKENRPGFKITKQLLDILPETRGKGEAKVANENHRADIAGIIEMIGQMVQAE